MLVTTQRNRGSIAAYIAGHLSEIAEKADDYHWGEYECIAIVVRRTIHAYGFGYASRPEVETEVHRTREQAWREYERLLHERQADGDFDGIVSVPAWGECFATLEGLGVGTYAREGKARLALAQAMIQHGIYPDTFAVNERGGSERIDLSRELDVLERLGCKWTGGK